MKKVATFGLYWPSMRENPVTVVRLSTAGFWANSASILAAASTVRWKLVESGMMSCPIT